MLSGSAKWYLTIQLLAIFSLISPAMSQGLAVDYERADNFPRRIEGAYSARTVLPHWLPSNDSFWYRRDLGQGKFEFMFVDAAKGVKQKAFDHQKLASALAKENATQVDPYALPFNWIDVSRNLSWVHFRAGNDTWQYALDGKLSKYSGELNEENLRPMRLELPSTTGRVSTHITFINRTPGPLALAWIDYSGTYVPYGILESGQISRRQTYVGHVWRLSNPTSGRTVAVYRATNNEAQAIIDDSKKIPDGAVKPPPVPEAEGTPSAKANRKAFVRKNNVWVRDEDGEETQISTNGRADYPYAWWNTFNSADGRFAVVWQYTPAQKHPLNLVESSPKNELQPRLISIPYLKPGDQVQVDRPRLFDLVSKKEIPTDDELFATPFELMNLGWSPDDSQYRFRYNQRGHQILRVIAVNRDGQVKTLIEETSKTFIDYSMKSYAKELKATNELIWASERDGWNHLYLYDYRTGVLKNQITKGSWAMRAVEKVDIEKRQIWFKGFGMVPGQDPYYAHFARVNFDGSGLQILTEGDGTHTWAFSPDGKFLTDTWSRVDLAPQSVLRHADTGKLATELEDGDGDLKSLAAVGWTTPERFEAPGRDGTTLIYGIIVKPSNFNAAKKYPVIEQIYAGPHDFSTPKSFGTLSRVHELAELGFIVVQIDGMGMNWRSKAFHDVCYKNLKDAGFPDRIAWMKAAAVTRPWMDLSRVGIYGGSAGGQNALAALLFHGGFYKVGIPDSGCHDNRMDKIWWNEQFMGWPVDKSYEDSSNVVHAGRLTGALLLLVGELDTNVDPASTLQVVHALNEAGKDYDLMFVPGGGHGVGSSRYGTRRQRDFFVKHLLGIDPPKRNGNLASQRISWIPPSTVPKPEDFEVIPIRSQSPIEDDEIDVHQLEVLRGNQVDPEQRLHE